MDFAYQWKADGVPIPGAVLRDYAVTIDDFGKVISCDVTATNSIGSTTASSSNSIAVPESYPVFTSSPRISGTATVGQVLTVIDNGNTTGISPITNTYQWRRNGVDISGAISSTYTLVVADRAAIISCNVRAANKYGWAESISNNIGPIS